MTQVFLSMSTDVVHNGHINIISKAAELGEVTVGVLTDEAIAKYKRYPLTPFEERSRLIENIKGVSKVVAQDDIDYTKILMDLKPDIVVHGDDWVSGPQAHIRQQVINTLESYGGKLQEFPYTISEAAEAFESKTVERLSMPDNRRARLKNLLAIKKPVTALEAHNGLTGLIVEKTMVPKGNGIAQFYAMWISSLTDSTAKGKPDIELVDNTSRLTTINQIMEVTTKPIILDADSGGLVEHFTFLVQTLERIGVSAVIIEDKIGLKRNSLFGAGVGQQQDSIEHFCEKISAAKAVQKTDDFMVIARCESLILEQGMDDALERTRAYVHAGADGIMIHSRKKDPAEIFEFVEKFRAEFPDVYLVVVPTTFAAVYEEEWAERGVNIVIYANHLIRAAFPAMKNTAETILKNGRCKEANEQIMPIKEVLTLIPEQ